MISSRNDLKLYLNMDAKALGVTGNRIIKLFSSIIWRYEFVLRLYEYHLNVTHNVFLKNLFRLYHHSLSVRLGLVIPPNVFMGGLRINHYGLVIVNPDARIGEWCDIHQGVNIGSGYDGVPQIGNNVWIGPGAKIYGKIVIADECAIGANAVVNKSFLEPNVTIAGIPAKVISEKGNRYIRKL